jgi:diguanylate cyclase (GGDEF)-like protein
MDVLSITVAMGFVQFFMLITFLGLSSVSKGEQFTKELSLASLCFFLSTVNGAVFDKMVTSSIFVPAISNGFYIAGHAAIFSAVYSLIYNKKARNIALVLGLFVFCVHFIPNVFNTPLKRVFLLYPLVFLMSSASLITLWKNRKSELGHGIRPLIWVFALFSLQLLFRGVVFVFDERAISVNLIKDHYFRLSGTLALLSFYFLITICFSIVLFWKKELKLNELANTDPLTGLLNRKILEQTLSQMYSRFKRTCQPFGLITLDIDNFKSINDTYGHVAGDTVIKAVAQTLKKQSRDYDFAFRLGGEEFLILAENLSESELENLSERIRSAIELNQIEIDHKIVTVTVSIGVAISTINDLNWNSIINRSDKVTFPRN